jgi:hypothetical protein
VRTSITVVAGDHANEAEVRKALGLRTDLGWDEDGRSREPEPVAATPSKGAAPPPGRPGRRRAPAALGGLATSDGRGRLHRYPARPRPVGAGLTPSG